MLNKKLIILAIFFVSLLAVSAVSASDNVTDDVVSVEETDITNIEINEESDLENDDLTAADGNEVLSTDPKTFSDLNTTVNGNDDSDVYLDGNYTFVSGPDDDFKSGIVIDRAVTVHGNGYTIDGNKGARIFNVYNSSAVFMDVIFKNAKITTGNGGAIYGAATLINCSFIANYARNGGAIYGNCTVINSTFTDNIATSTASGPNIGYGGAFYGMGYSSIGFPSGGYAENCTFTGNFAINGGGGMFGASAENCTFIDNSVHSSGGAISSGNAMHCTFIGNSARDYEGGAIRGSSTYEDIFVTDCVFIGNSAKFGGAIAGDFAVANCIFENNSASSGGAVLDCSALNCTFTGNKANVTGDDGKGGAMEYGSAVNCTFIGNSAKIGGATYLANANNCRFISNNATENGGAMADGVCANSNFTQNHADIDGGAIFNVAVSNSLFEYNNAANGGAMAQGIVMDSKFNYNNAAGYGGAIYNAKVSTNNEFIGNAAPNGEDTYNVTWFEKGNAKTFSDLNEIINGNNDDDIYLNDNYMFDPHYDFDFIYGVVVSRAVTVHGNFHTIDGWEGARMFTVTNSSAVFRDINFVNGKILFYDGGAIKGKSTAINCNFVNNSVTSEYGSGGAMEMGTAINCNFTGNYAGKNGGAIDFGDAVNCNFNNNHASDRGGAINTGLASNCTFINNSAKDGGALYGSAENCTFINNSASNGGAVNSGNYYRNCTFINNTANAGGAAYYGSAYDSTFIGNSAKNGGATYSTTATDCKFINNNATGYGGAMYSGTANDCMFKGNVAGTGGNDTYSTTVHHPDLSVSDFASYYNSGSKLAISFVAGSGKQITDAEVTIRVYKNEVLVGTYYCLSGNGWEVSLDAGNYTAVVSVENQGYDVDPANATLTITPVSTTISAPAVSAVYNVNNNLVVTLKDANNNAISGVSVTIKLSNGKTVTPVTDKNGQVKLSTSGLVPKDYTATITFAGNTNYIKSSASAKITVKKATPKLTAKAKKFKKSVKTKKYTVTLKDNVGKAMKNVQLTIKVGKKTYKAKTNAKGVATFKIKKLTKKGKYKSTVTYKGDNNYNKATKNVKITIK